NGKAYYSDYGEEVTAASFRPCAKCGGHRTPEGHDPCIANLPGVTSACCGHGLGGYIAFEDRRVIRFPRAHIEDGAKVALLKSSRWRIIVAMKARGPPMPANLRCMFYDRHQWEVRKMISGTTTRGPACICDACVGPVPGNLGRGRDRPLRRTAVADGL